MRTYPSSFNDQVRAADRTRALTPACGAIILINTLAFLLGTILSGDGASFCREHGLSCSPFLTLRCFQFWQLMSATLFHANVVQFAWNMSFLWIVGSAVEDVYGSRDFLAFYVCASFMSMLGWVVSEALPFGFVHVDMISAGGAVMATAMLFVLTYPSFGVPFLVPRFPSWIVPAVYFSVGARSPMAGVVTQNAAVLLLAGGAFACVFKQFNLRLSRLT